MTPSYCYYSCFCLFQEESGIRDGHVTGVQTCALPIFEGPGAVRVAPLCRVITAAKGRYTDGSWTLDQVSITRFPDQRRSEERRVGKECKNRSAAGRQKKTEKSIG